MRNPSKLKFEDYKIQKVSGGDLLREKPIFFKNGANLLLSSQETCHVYSTTTGEHVAELFSVDSAIITLLEHPNKKETVLVATQNGKIFTYNDEIDETPKEICQLDISEESLENFKIPKFAEKKSLAWTKENIESITFYHTVIDNGLIYASWRASGEKFGHGSVFQLESGKVVAAFPNIKLQKTPENIALGKDYVLLMGYNFVYVAQKSNVNNGVKHNIDSVTKIATDREESMFATGDRLGQITIWRNIFLGNPLKELYHWHTMPVTALVFTECGSHLLSGGEENVLVKWSLSSSLKNFLPRLSATIQHITCAAGNALVSVTTADSRILILNLNLSCLATIQHFSRWSTVESGRGGAILEEDPRKESLVLPGRIGHLQFLSAMDRGRFLYTLDVTQRNVITRERNSNGSNVHVTWARFTRCGKWLITFEAGAEESRLKFWQFDGGKRQWSLNTDVEAPHGPGGIHTLEINFGEMAVTTGPDDMFRLWAVVESHHLHQVRLHWAAVGSGTYRQQQCNAADFAQDGSLVAVAFGPTLTLWDTEKCELKTSLTAPLQRTPVVAVRFGRQALSHLVVAGTNNELSCWNIVTLCRQWVVPLGLQLLISDPGSSFMCAFTTSNSLFIFDPASPQPEFSLNNVSSSKIVAALFTHRADPPQLYFLTSAQELYCLGGEAKAWSAGDTDIARVTPFAAQLPGKARVDVRKNESLGALGVQRFTADVLDGPAHALPHVSLLCEDLLRALMLRTHVSDMETEKSAESAENLAVEPSDIQMTKNNNQQLQESDLKETVDRIFSNNFNSKIFKR